MASAEENRKFVEAILPNWPLDDAIDWISKNLKPEDVFEEDTLKTWSEEQGVENVFSEDTLGMWARNNGYEKPSY